MCLLTHFKIMIINPLYININNIFIKNNSIVSKQNKSSEKNGIFFIFAKTLRSGLREVPWILTSAAALSLLWCHVSWSLWGE